MTLKNYQIYNYATALTKEFGVDCTIKLPVRVNFYLQKNIENIKILAIEIEDMRNKIVSENSIANESGVYEINPDKIELVQKELDDLANLTLEVNLYPLKLDSFDGVDLTYQQMNALMFMIEE